MNPTTVQIVSAAIFAIAILHTFAASFVERLAHVFPSHAKLWHLLSEVEAVFGFWAIVLVVFLVIHSGHKEAAAYLDHRDYTEPMFVFAIMVVAASRPVIQFAAAIVEVVSRVIPLSRPVAVYFTIMTIVPLLGSFITEPAAMTLAALMLKELYYSKGISSRLMYATIGVLFVSVSIGGTLTNFAAPPVLMVAKTWDWSSWYMLTHFGWRSALAVFINAIIVTFLFRKELRQISLPEKEARDSVPATMVAIHLFLLFVVVFFAHHPPVFIGAFLFFMGLATAYPQYQERLMLREGLMVAFFLAGLVTLGGQQIWWLQNLLTKMDATSIYYGATALTAVTDNAALTYLGSLVEGLTEDFKYALVAGAVTGGGLTVIANAPNPAGMSILRGDFKGSSVSPLWLFLAALPPTLVTIVAFRFL
ncbi:MAG: putative Na+/H+ antiporter [Betaproteobacteria bacterium]|nr:putative Na+/H+ antiporter [Betaproteobacteria bacterium]